MANTLNNFGLAEKTLNTAGKWCTADIEVKIDSAELKYINSEDFSEYLRSGVEVFGVTGSYGEATDEVTIPAGIYEVYFTSEDCLNFGNVVEINYYNCGNYYVAVDLDSRDECINFWSSYNNGTGGNLGTLEPGLSTKNVGSYNFLNFLVYVPVDTELSAADAKKWYKIMHPYVSSAALNTHTFKLPNKLPCSDTGEAGAYIRDLFEILGEAEPYNAGYSIDMLVYRCVVPFQTYANDDTVFEVQRVDLKENPNSEELRLSIAGDRESNNSFGEGTLLYSGGTSGSAYYDGHFSMEFDEAKDYQYWHFKNNYSEINPAILAFLIAIGAEPDPTFECERCGETCYVSDCEVLWRCEDCKDKICNHTTGSGSSLVTTYKRLSATNHLTTTRCKYCTYTTSSSEAHTLAYDDTPGHSYYYCSKCNMPTDTANCSEWHDIEHNQPCGTCGLGYTTCPSCGTQWFFDSYCSHCGYSGASGETCPHNNVGDDGYCYDCNTFVSSGCESGNHVLEGSHCINCGLEWVYCGGYWGDGEHCDNYGWYGTSCDRCGKTFGND